MALHWRPTGPHPPATYWRRRATLGVALLVLLLVGRACSGGGAARPTGQSSPAPHPRATAAASASPRPMPSSSPADLGPVPLCADGDLLVTPTTDAASYTLGSAPVLTVTIKNAGQAVCRRAVGPGAVEMIITSGSDRIWSSQDCAPGGPQELTTLRPGDQRVLRMTWAGHRSAPGCSGPKAAVQPGTYRLTAQVGTLRQLGATFHVT